MSDVPTKVSGEICPGSARLTVPWCLRHRRMACVTQDISFLMSCSFFTIPGVGDYEVNHSGRHNMLVVS